MASDPTIKAYNKLVHHLRRIGVNGAALRKLALATGNPVILEQTEEALALLAGVDVMATAAVEELWRRQPLQRAQNHVVHQQKKLGFTVQ